MIWIIEIPIAVFAVLGLLGFGAAQEVYPGHIISAIGWLQLVGSAILALVGFFGDETDAGKRYGIAVFLTVLSVVVILIGNSMGDLNAFEILFGTGWF